MSLQKIKVGTSAISLFRVFLTGNFITYIIASESYIGLSPHSICCYEDEQHRQTKATKTCQ